MNVIVSPFVARRSAPNTKQLDFLFIVNILEIKGPMLVNDVNSKISVNLSHCCVDALCYLLSICLVILFVVEIEILIVVFMTRTALSLLRLFNVVLLDNGSLEQHIFQIDDGPTIDHDDGMEFSIQHSLLNHAVVEFCNALIG